MKRVIASAVIGATAIFGGAGIFDDNTVRGDNGEILEGGGLGVFVMQAGDCFNVPDGLQVVSIEAVPCHDPHDAEVYALFDIEGSVYPGDDAVDSATDLGCYQRFEGFVGHAYETSVLDIYSLHPLEDGWVELNDREVVCSIVNYDGSKLIGSQAGAGI